MSTATPLAYTLTEAAQAAGVSKRTLQRALAAGDLTARYPTRRPVVLAEDLRAWLESTPSEPPAA